jgi:hypothetical protein
MESLYGSGWDGDAAVQMRRPDRMQRSTLVEAAAAAAAATITADEERVDVTKDGEGLVAAQAGEMANVS